MSFVADSLLRAQAADRLKRALAAAAARTHIPSYGLMCDLTELATLERALTWYALAARELEATGEHQVAQGLLVDVARLRDLAIEDLIGMEAEPEPSHE